ncbi:YgaP family membrane protein [Hydromonas duriensis]|uniref:Inner membrane protein YgaP-like transmembrane domain-containing protein n=1 Tax=Hydromonas duriensis TaxID=1527608 RepID=A0A4R6YAX8_9BURK|nr:DUF2892 domain-containing protein [Hydromonas duriensis]TDR32716.1 hypothetical protein DFR44_10212 [Hydromonas duriensis]
MESNANKSNVGRVDRVLRVVVGAVLILLAMFGQIGAWGWLGIILLFTGLMRFCPVYTLFGVNKNCPKD